MINVGIVLYGRTTWKDLKAETYLSHQGEKREKTLCMCRISQSFQLDIFCNGDEGGFNQTFQGKPRLQAENALLPCKGRIVKPLADFRYY